MLSKPKWAPNAIATERGWEDPKTGELLVSVRNLKSRIQGEQKETPAPKKAAEKPKAEEVVEETPKEEPKAETKEETQETPTKTTRKTTARRTTRRKATQK